MDKKVSMREAKLIKKAIQILEYLDISYDIEKLKKRPDICKEIVMSFKDECIL